MVNVLKRPYLDADDASKLDVLLDTAIQDVNEFLEDPENSYVTPSYLAFITAVADYCGYSVRDLDVHGLRLAEQDAD